MSEFIGPEASAWDSKLDKYHEWQHLEAKGRLGELALWRVLEDMNMWNRYLIDNDPNYSDNRQIYNGIITGETDELPE